MKTSDVVKIIKKHRREYKREVKLAYKQYDAKYKNKSRSVQTSGEAQNRLKVKNMYQDKVDACNRILAEIPVEKQGGSEG